MLTGVTQRKGLDKQGSLYKLDPDSDKATLVIEHPLFTCCSSMVSHGDYLFIARSTFLYNLYRVDPVNRTYVCLGNDWNGASLASREDSKDTLYARYNCYFYDNIYEIKYLSAYVPYYELKSYVWSVARVPSIVSHARYLYTQGSDGDLFIVEPFD